MNTINGTRHDLTEERYAQIISDTRLFVSLLVASGGAMQDAQDSIEQFAIERMTPFEKLSPIAPDRALEIGTDAAKLEGHPEIYDC